MNVAGQVLPAGADREEWLAARRLGLGGTDVAALVGIHPYRTALGVYLEKTQFDVAGDDDELNLEEGADARYWGMMLEEPVAVHFARRNGVTLCRTGTWSRDGWQLASPDRLIIPGPTEKMSTSRTPQPCMRAKRPQHGCIGSGTRERCRDHYVIQVQWYLHVLGLDVAHIAALIGGQQYVQVQIVRDQELIDGLVSVAARFWAENVLSLAPPSLRGESAKAALDLLSRMHPVSVEGSRVDLGQEFRALLDEWEAEKALARMHEKRAQELQVAVREQMGGAEAAYVHGELVCRAVNLPAAEIAFTRKPSRRFIVQKGITS